MMLQAVAGRYVMLLIVIGIENYLRFVIGRRIACKRCERFKVLCTHLLN